jgi:hypothetical protein
MDMKKLLVVGIIFLFIGVAIVPSINFNIVRASQDNDFVEVTTQACGVDGYANTTVKLTREQYQNLKQYLVEFRAKLNQTTTREEAVPIFKEAVLELNKYGLLPKGMGVERAQQLITGYYQQRGYERLMKTPFLKNQMNASNRSNYLCLVYSAINGTSPVVLSGPIIRAINNGMFVLFYSPGYVNIVYNFLVNHSVILSKIFGRTMGLLFLLFLFPWWYGPAICTFMPVNILYTICLGVYHGIYYNSSYEPALGWIATFGLLGKRVYQNQSLWGNLPVIPETSPWGLSYFYPGIIGFTGFHILPYPDPKTNKHYFFGSSLWVKIGSEPPENSTSER